MAIGFQHTYCVGHVLGHGGAVIVVNEVQEMTRLVSGCVNCPRDMNTAAGKVPVMAVCTH